jgi:hypothetical protein
VVKISFYYSYSCTVFKILLMMGAVKSGYDENRLTKPNHSTTTI